MGIYSNILSKIDNISGKYKRTCDELYEEYYRGTLDEQSELYKYFEDIESIINISSMSGAIKRRDDALIITEKGKEYKFPYTFYSDINILN